MTPIQLKAFSEFKERRKLWETDEELSEYLYVNATSCKLRFYDEIQSILTQPHLSKF